MHQPQGAGDRAATKRVARALVKASDAPFYEGFKAGRALLVESLWEDMSDGADPPTPRHSLIRTRAEANKYLWGTAGGDGAEHQGLMTLPSDFAYKAGKVTRCKGACCQLEGGGGMNVKVIHKLCFWPLSADKAVLVYLDIMLHGT